MGRVPSRNAPQDRRTVGLRAEKHAVTGRQDQLGLEELGQVPEIRYLDLVSALVEIDHGDQFTRGARIQRVRLGRELPMEVHFVHRSDAGVLAVVGVLIAEGQANSAYAPIWEKRPAKAGAHASVAALTLDVDALLPKGRSALRYTGSLTTPPCSEGVRWLVLTEPAELSAEQIAAFTALYDDNNRPTQPLHGRSLVLEELK